MARCTECQTEWTIKDKARVFKSLSGELKCPYCGKKQVLSLTAQKQMGMANMILPVAMLLPIPFNVPLPIHLTLIILGIIAVIVLNISLVKLSGKKEYPI